MGLFFILGGGLFLSWYLFFIDKISVRLPLIITTTVYGVILFLMFKDRDKLGVFGKITFKYLLLSGLVLFLSIFFV